MPGLTKRLFASTAAVATLLLVSPAAFAQGPRGAPAAVQMTVRADQPGAVIDKAVYGQFAEHLGRGIYEGVWVGPDSKIPNTRGYRNDVVQALKTLKVPLVRWPGGCFADEYHWRDGIGPREKRPVKVNTNWGGVTEDNSFGTHEFLDFAELIGADAYVNGNVGTGTPQENAEWVEYITSDTQSTLAELRRTNGRDKPWKLPYFAIGNETWGCGGGMRPEYYADLYRHFITFVKAPKGNRPLRIASGANADDYNYTEVMLKNAAKFMDGYTLHYYTLPTGDWKVKGNATEFGEAEWIATMSRTLRMDELVTKHSAIMDKHDPQKRIGLYVDEWGTWYDPRPGDEPGFLYQQNSLRDALVAAINLNIFHNHADRVRMSNIAQMVNVLQAMILTDKEKMVLTPTYHVFEMYNVFQGATALPLDLTTPQYRVGEVSVPAVSASAARDRDGIVRVALANLDPNRPADVSARLAGLNARQASGRVLTAPAINTINTFEQPEAVKPQPFTGARLQGDQLSVTLPPKSIVVLALR